LLKDFNLSKLKKLTIGIFLRTAGRNQRDEWLHRLVGGNVKRIRKEKGVSQLDLSYAMGLRSVSLVSKAEITLERKHFNLTHLDQIAAILEVDIRDFFQGWKPPENMRDD
jgi:hypothetical protein